MTGKQHLKLRQQRLHRFIHVEYLKQPLRRSTPHRNPISKIQKLHNRNPTCIHKRQIGCSRSSRSGATKHSIT
ncbi:hypothetical protein HanXRQr2_Chr01g0018281 [Helianthus annuus]|uniref:Uncharacterized protein n=1 Tax=Helianthus annuus TaxID=4232 RepID=A0A9K3JW62_HELAN|nr:hypothetical protein HanXRQr2_Chr01g0018281 [Helianthus annuus]KAJ0956643.1 hypothetical protein HanPSC8_Chr01g0017671 [Helianthus annuus]